MLLLHHHESAIFPSGIISLIIGSFIPGQNGIVCISLDTLLIRGHVVYSDEI